MLIKDMASVISKSEKMTKYTMMNKRRKKMNIRRMKMKILAYLLCCEFPKHSNPRHSVKDII